MSRTARVASATRYVTTPLTLRVDPAWSAHLPTRKQARHKNRNEMENHVAQKREGQRSAALCGGKFQGTVIDVDLCPC